MSESIVLYNVDSRATDTVLGEAADPTELFLVDECDDMQAESIEGKVNVISHRPAKDWFDVGGLEEGNSPVPPGAADTFFYQLWSAILFLDLLLVAGRCINLRYPLFQV